MANATIEAPANGTTAVRKRKVAVVTPEMIETTPDQQPQSPYVARVTLRGTSDLLFHRWNVEAIKEKARGAKGSVDKRTDQLDSYVYRLEDGRIGLPGEYLRMCLVSTSKFHQDPRSPRKSAADLWKAGIVSLTDLAPMERTKFDTRGQPEHHGKDPFQGGWDAIDERRVMVQRQGVNRRRPRFHKGWEATLDLMVNLPEYISVEWLRLVLTQAGKVTGIADFRPTFGRFQVASFDVLNLEQLGDAAG